MFDDIIPGLLLLLLISVGGWLAGIIGFFRAGRALRELRAVRMQLDRISAASPATAPVSQPFVADTPVAEAPIANAEDLSTVPTEDPAPAVAPGRKAELEELITARWGVWLGAATLLLAGVFLIRYAAEEGWLGPAVRCFGLAALGAGLIGLGFRSARRPVTGLRFADQAPAALAAGGVVMLFGAAYAASVLYALVSPVAGFVLMAAASLTGLAVALRLGQLVAAVGIVGAFMTPLLVESDTPSWPGLFIYLLFVSAASLATVRYAAWVWLGWATTIAASAWVLLASLTVPAADAWVPALFVPALVALHLALLPAEALERPVGRRLAWIPILAVGAAGLLLAFSAPDTATRAAVLLLAPITLAAAAREERLVGVPWVAAGLFLVLMAFWDLPIWSQTGEPIWNGQGGVVAILPGSWTPTALQPFLTTLSGMSAVFAIAGFAGVWWLRRPVAWASFVAAVPVLALALGYARVRQFQPDAAWAAVTLAAAAALVGLAALASRRGRGIQAVGVLAAGATAGLSLAFAMLLTAQWLTIALVLLVPALVWIEAAADLPPLRRVALAVAAVALARLLFNTQVLYYVDGQSAVLNGRALAYAAGAGAFWFGARLARRRADDRLVAVLEIGCAAFVTALAMLEIRQWSTGGYPSRDVFTFAEAGLQVSALATLACLSLWLDQRNGRASLRWSWMAQGGLALAGGLALLLANPAVNGSTSVDGPPVLDALLTTYALPALLALWARLQLESRSRIATILAWYAFAAGFAWVTLEVRHIAHPGTMGLNDTPVLDWELWAWSGAWMAIAVGLMAAGLLRERRTLRLAALAVMAVVVAKVFLVDMAGLTGLWRVLSFLGLGLTLIGLGRLYGRLAKHTVPEPI